MKIALISGALIPTPPPHYGGMEQVCFDLACGLTELGHKTVVFATKGSQVPPKGFLCETIEPTYSVQVDWLGKEMEMYKLYRDKLCDFDAICGHNWFGCEYLYKSEHPEARVSHCHHGGLLWRSKPPNVEKLNLIAISKWMQKVYASQGFESRVCYDGIDTSRYGFSADRGSRLLYVGRFTGFKGAHIAIQVAKRLNVPIDLVGGSFTDDPNYLEQIKRMCDGDSIRMYLDAPHETKIRLMQQAKCVLVPSNFGEPCGLVPIEFMSTGGPAIVWDDGALKETVADGVTGFVVPKTVEAMVEAVKRVDEIRPEACRKRVEEKFSRQIMCANYLSVYNRILSGDEW